MTSAAKKPVNWEKYAAADPLITVVDDLEIPIAILRAVFLAFGNPEASDIGYKEDCLRALEHAAGQVADVQKAALNAVNQIREDV